MITMRGLSRFIAETLNTNAEFIALSNSLTTGEFNYYVNTDLATLKEITMPYFSVITFDDKDEKEVQKVFETALLIGIERSKPVTASGITEEPTFDNLESLARKAMEIIAKELRDFGVQGEKNIKISYIDYFCPSPDGEVDLSMQVSIAFEQDKYLC